LANKYPQYFCFLVLIWLLIRVNGDILYVLKSSALRHTDQHVCV